MPQSSAARLDLAPPLPASFEDDVTLLQLARRAQRMQAHVARVMPRGVLRDSAWDMLLELFVAAQESRALCVKQLVLASGETSTSALRRIDRLEDSGLIQRRSDPDDNRRVTVGLTAKGDEAMSTMLRSLRND